jgi:hypothetical protein
MLLEKRRRAVIGQPGCPGVIMLSTLTGESMVTAFITMNDGEGNLRQAGDNGGLGFRRNEL